MFSFEFVEKFEVIYSVPILFIVVLVIVIALPK